MDLRAYAAMRGMRYEPARTLGARKIAGTRFKSLNVPARARAVVQDVAIAMRQEGDGHVVVSGHIAAALRADVAPVDFTMRAAGDVACATGDARPWLAEADLRDAMEALARLGDVRFTWDGASARLAFRQNAEPVDADLAVRAVIAACRFRAAAAAYR